jgi:hypothetical protein
MTIKFVCSCGKRLRARDHMAARRLACPRCGAPVGIPSSSQANQARLVNPFAPPARPRRADADSTEPGWEPNEAASRAAAELADRLRQMGDDGFVELTAASARPKAAEPLIYRPSKFRKSWDPGTRWYHCLVFPRAALGRILFLGCLLGLFALIVPVEARRLLTVDETQNSNRLMGGAGLVVATLVLVSQISAWFVCVLAAEKAGQYTVTSLSLRQVGLAARSLAMVACTFLGGPAFFAGLGLWFWIHTGKMLLVDWFILGELCFVMAGYWLFALAEACLSRWPRVGNPIIVAQLVHQLGWKAIVLAGLAWGLTVLFLTFVVQALQPVENSVGVFVILGCGILCIQGGSILLRFTGMWCRLALKDLPGAPGHASNSTPGSPVLTSPIK